MLAINSDRIAQWHTYWLFLNELIFNKFKERIMWQKIFNLVILFTALMVLGCDDELVAPPKGQSNIISGETKLIDYVNPGIVKQLGSGNIQVRNQVAIFKDSSSNAELSGLRNVVLNHNFNSNGQGNSYGTFSVETNSGLWEGDWTGQTTSSGTTIKAIGYNFDERGQSCEWTYYFPSSQDGKVGTFSARIIYERDEI
jgi:hypothetical protein